MKKVCIVGGGAAGLMAAYAAAKNGNDVLLFEKNEKLGKKIYITGKGRCNITNDISPDEFLENVVRGRKFLTGAVWSFPPKSVMEFFISHGLPLKPNAETSLSRFRARERCYQNFGKSLSFGRSSIFAQ